MSELNNELRSLAERVAAFEDKDVAASGAEIAALFRRERLIAFGLSAVESMVAEGPGTGEINENDPRLVAVKEKMRSRLEALLAWAKETGRA